MKSRSYPCTRPGDTVHHLYPNGPDQDLVPFCGETPGPDERSVWHTGHSWPELIVLSSLRKACCVSCLSRTAPDVQERGSGPDDDTNAGAQGPPE